MKKFTNFVYKILSRIRYFNRVHFGNTSNAILNMGVLLLGIVLTSFVYPYVKDNSNRIKILLGVFFISLLVFYIAKYFLLGIITILRRISRRTILSLVLIPMGVYKFLENGMARGRLEDFQQVLLVGLVSLVLIVFTKSLVGLLKRKSKILYISLVFSIGGILGGVYFMLIPGFVENNVGNFKYTSGDLQVEYSDYNLGEFDLRGYVNYSDDSKKYREKILGVELSKAPIRGRIYYPKEEGEYPLFLIVHGNHVATTPSYLGYDYLLEHLAKNGYIAASVDESFLNSMWEFGLTSENDARAILLLENIRALLEEYKNIDSNKIYLAGHSRGGEAISLAYIYNGLQFDPDNGNKSLDYNFKIKGLIGISPTYGQNSLQGKNYPLVGVDYLSIHGTNDADLKGYEGLNRYLSVSTENNFKASIYIHGANHGQFNTLWGSYDTNFPATLFVERGELIPSNVQQDLLKVSVVEFLKASESGDFYFFKDIEKYFPMEIYSRFNRGEYFYINDFEGDYDLTNPSVPGNINYKISSITEKPIKIGGEEIGSNGLFISTSKGSYYELNLKDDIDILDYFTFDVGNESRAESLGFDIEFMDYYGNTSKLNSNDYVRITPAVDITLSKFQRFTKKLDKKYDLISVEIPREDIFNGNPSIDTTRIKSVKFIFKDSGRLVFDNIGFSKVD